MATRYAIQHKRSGRYLAYRPDVGPHGEVTYDPTADAEGTQFTGCTLPTLAEATLCLLGMDEFAALWQVVPLTIWTMQDFLHGQTPSAEPTNA